jgi:hypothetical protein
MVLADVDDSLAAWLRAALPDGTRIDFGSPAALIDYRRTGRSPCTVNLFLHDIVEDVAGLATTSVYVRGADGRVMGTQAPLRHYRLSYLITAWAADAAEEHRVLGQILAAHSGHDVLTTDWLHGALRELDIAIPVRLGAHQSGPTEPSTWAALGIPARTSIELSVIAPVPPTLNTDIAPPVRQVGLDVGAIPRPTPPRSVRELP